MDPLRRESGTVVNEAIESLEAVQALDAALRKESPRATAKPGRQLLGKMRWEMAAFFDTYKGIAPDERSFAKTLVDALIQCKIDKPYDSRAAEDLCGDFVDCFAGHGWSSTLLQKAGRATILGAAAHA